MQSTSGRKGLFAQVYLGHARKPIEVVHGGTLKINDTILGVLI